LHSWTCGVDEAEIVTKEDAYEKMGERRSTDGIVQVYNVSTTYMQEPFVRYIEGM